MRRTLTNVRLALVIVRSYVAVSLRLGRLPLPVVMEWAGQGGIRTAETPVRLSRAVDRVLRIGPRRLRCLPRAVVLFRLLSAQGTQPQLVIGLPSSGEGHSAHAWVELEGRDLGPLPGSMGHVELARF